MSNIITFPVHFVVTQFKIEKFARLDLVNEAEFRKIMSNSITVLRTEESRKRMVERIQKQEYTKDLYNIIHYSRDLELFEIPKFK